MSPLQHCEGLKGEIGDLNFFQVFIKQKLHFSTLSDKACFFLKVLKLILGYMDERSVISIMKVNFH